MTAHSHVKAELGLIEKYLAPRWKAIIATVVPLVGGVITLSSTNTLDVGHVWGLIATALASGGITHQVANIPASTSAANTDVEDILPVTTTTGTTSVPAASVPSSALPGVVSDDDTPGA